MDKEKRKFAVLREEMVEMKDLRKGDIFHPIPASEGDINSNPDMFFKAASEPWKIFDKENNSNFHWGIDTQTLAIVEAHLPKDFNFKKKEEIKPTPTPTNGSLLRTNGEV